MTGHCFPRIWVVLIILYIDLADASIIKPDIYIAGEHYSEWSFNGSKAKCELKHEIPQFGVSRFLRLAGEELTFQIKSFQRTPNSTEGLLREISPSWKHVKPDPLTRQIELKQGLLSVELSRKESSWLLASLAKGQMPSFDFLDWNDARKEVFVRLSPVNYLKPYREFKRCLKGISDKGFEHYRLIEVHFPVDVHKLIDNEKENLKQLADFLIADTSIRAIRIGGHADDQGTREYNKKLSIRRADNVEEFIRSLGLRSVNLEKNAYGETRPKIESKSEHARAENRRVEIQLFR